MNATRVGAVTRSATDWSRRTISERSHPVDTLADEVPALRRMVAGHLHCVGAAFQPCILWSRDVSTPRYYNIQRSLH